MLRGTFVAHVRGAKWWTDCDEIDDLEICDVEAIAFEYTDKPAGVVCHGKIEERVQKKGGGVSSHATGAPSSPSSRTTTCPSAR